ncbi:serine hydrolase domain-containing protein [Hyphobacterium sp.]|uniref:serine hydrolase domain-containing protein n=1 Tax=Hyphobacterium sp. TaxID=2004662 RepID=UPI003747CFCC
MHFSLTAITVIVSVSVWSLADGAGFSLGADQTEAPSSDDVMDPQSVQCVLRLVDSRQFHGVALIGSADGSFEVVVRDQQAGHVGEIEAATRFNTGSMFKVVTAVSIAQLVERRLLSYDDTLGMHMQGIPLAYREVTIAELLSHTGGAGNFPSPEDMELVLSHESLPELRHVVFSEPLGTRGDHRYSNAGYIILGLLIEGVSGLDYESYIQSNVLDVAEMTNTTLRPDRGMAQPFTRRRMPSSERQQRDGEERSLTRSPIGQHRGTPAGGVFSTAEDIFRFARAFLNNELISSTQVDTLLEGRVGRVTRAGVDGEYGYGFALYGDGSAGHSGGGPGVNGSLRFFRETGTIVVALTNVDPPMASNLAAALTHQISNEECQ